MGIFGLEFEKSYCHIWNLHPRICQNTNFHVKKVWVLDLKYLFWILLGQNLKKLLSYLKFAPSNLSKMQSFMLNNKKKYLRPKLLYFCLVREFEKTIVIFEISTLEFIKNEFLTIIVNLGIESVFSKSPAGPGLSPLYNVCQLFHIPWVISYVSSDYDYIYMKVIFISKQFNFYLKKNINMELKTFFFYISLNKNRVT